jgi:NAD(P)-dependent dehydrogenase (short-subunit alcohol dehydrogenase family)
MANILIIAGSSTIGKVVLEKLKAQEDKLYVTTRNEEILEELKKEFECEGECIDASSFEAVDRCFENAKAYFSGDINGVVNFSGSIILKPSHLTSQEEYESTLEANLKTAFATVRAAGKHMSKQGGSVVLISSAAAVRGLPNHEAIAAAKGGIIGLVRSAAATYADKNLRFNAIAPGLVDTKLSKDIINNELSMKVSLSMHAMHQVGQPKDIANAIVFLLDESNHWQTGDVISIDGGLGNLMPKLKI